MPEYDINLQIITKTKLNLVKIIKKDPDKYYSYHTTVQMAYNIFLNDNLQISLQ